MNTYTNFLFFYLIIFFIVAFSSALYHHWIIPKSTRPSLDLRSPSADGNGTLERTEILKAAYSDKDLSNFLTPKRSNQAYSAMGGGKPVDLESFKQFCRKASSSKLVQVSPNDEEREKFQTMFKRLDGNNNGTLERMELYKASHMDKELGQYVAPRQCGDAFKRMDTMNNGKVTFESFLAFCMDVRA